MKIIITESQYRFLVENSQKIDQILDKMNEFGYENLENYEKMTLNRYSEWLKSGKNGDFDTENTPKTPNFDEKTGEMFTTTLQDGSDFTYKYDYSDVEDNEIVHYGTVEWDGESWYGLIATDKDNNFTEFDFISDQTMFNTYDIDDESTVNKEFKEKRLQDSLGKMVHQVKYFFEEEVIPYLTY